MIALICAFLSSLSYARPHGGSDSGGGQGVFDRKTGLVHFADILSPDDIKQMDLAQDPETLVFSKFPSCTKVSSTELPYDDEPAVRVLRDLEPYLGEFAGKFSSYYYQGFSHHVVTSLHLNQIKDATSVAPAFQIQLAIYSNGIAYFQEQALTLMPPDEVKWLLVKEILRFEANDLRVSASNVEIEEALRFIYKGDGPSFANSAYFLKLKASPEIYGPKYKYTSDPSANDSGGDLADLSGMGFIPAWALKFGSEPSLYSDSAVSKEGGQFFIFGYSTREAGKYHGYDVETGKKILDLFGKCSK